MLDVSLTIVRLYPPVEVHARGGYSLVLMDWRGTMRNKVTRAIVFVLAAAAGHFIDPSPAEESCIPIQFGERKDTIVINGSVLPQETRCYRLDTVEGQKVTVKVLRGKNIVFSIENVTDAQDALTFTAESTSYRVIVGQLLRSRWPQAFQISIAKGKPQL